MKKRHVYLDVPVLRRLDHWCHLVARSFDGDPPYLVGSVLERPDWRDVDVRLLLADRQVAAIPMNLRDLNMIVSDWGRSVTALPIDFQIQPETEWRKYDDRPRHPRGVGLAVWT